MLLSVHVNFAGILTAILTLVGLLCLRRYLRGAKYHIAPSVDLAGKTAIVTGGAAGLGKQTVRQLLKLNCAVIVADCNQELSLKSIKQLKKQRPSARLQYEFLDLADLGSISEFVQRLTIKGLDYLVNNAGVYNMREGRRTRQNFQMDFGVNYIGHFYLTYLLWPLLNNSQGFRVVNLASVTHKRKHLTLWGQPTLDFTDLNITKGYSPNEAYARSKLCIVMGTKHIANIMGESHKGRVVSVHPGIVRTGIMDQAFTFGVPGRLLQVLWWVFYPLYAFMTKDVVDGCQTTLKCLLDGSVTNGAYYAQCQVEGISPFASDENCRKLWEQTEKMLSVRFRVG